MLLSEQVRILEDEEQLINDPTAYSTSGNSWGDLHSYGDITLEKDQIVVFTYHIKGVADGFDVYCNHRLLFDTLRADGHKVSPSTDGTEEKDVRGMVFLNAGTYTVKVQAVTDAAATFTVSNMIVGKARFSDIQDFDLNTYSSSISLNLPERELAAGAVKNGLLWVQAEAYTPSNGQFYPTCWGSGYNAVGIKVDGVAEAWTWSEDDAYGSDNAKDFHGAAAARLTKILSAGSNHTVEITKENAGTVVYISIVFTPWLLKDSLLEPINLDFPQGSTVYVTLEPLMTNPTKELYIGKKRGISFGDATDYYYTNSGTGILESDYTFEAVEVSGCVLQVKGFGGCISIIGVDIR